MQEQFTKEEGAETKKSVEELFDAIPRSRRFDYLGYLNDIMLFLDAAIRQAPNEPLSTK